VPALAGKWAVRGDYRRNEVRKRRAATDRPGYALRPSGAGATTASSIHDEQKKKSPRMRAKEYVINIL